MAVNGLIAVAYQKAAKLVFEAFPSYVHILHPCLRRALFTPLNCFFYRILFSLKDRLNSAVWVIPDPSFHAKIRGSVSCVRSEKKPLHKSFYCYVRPCRYNISGMKEIAVIGGGLAGCEAAAQIARLGGRVILYEMKPLKFSPAHRLSGLAELVCSNSLKSDSLTNASGLLKEEMRRLSSLIVLAAEAERVPAGGSLSVDRLKFSSFITGYLEKAGVRIVREEIRRLPDSRPLIIATGPLTSDAFAGEPWTLLGKENLYFYDAISPVVFSDCVDFNIAFMGSRYNKGGPDYVNCPMDRTLYERFVEELLSAGKNPLRPFENIPFFEGCMPVEALAERGKKTLSFGPLKPVGIIDPRGKRRPYAVGQLREEKH